MTDTPKSPSTFTIGSLEVVLTADDITRLPEPVDVIVSSDGRHLCHDGGVSAAIWRAAKRPLVDPVPELRLGDVLRSQAGELRAKHVLHAITIDRGQNKKIGPRDAVELWGKVLDTANELGARTLAAPLLGGRTARLGHSGSAVALFDAIALRVNERGSLCRITVADPKGLDVCQAVFESRELPRPLGEILAQLAPALPSETATRLHEVWSSSASVSSAIGAVSLLEVLLQALAERGIARANEESNRNPSAIDLSAGRHFEVVGGRARLRNRPTLVELFAAAEEAHRVAGAPIDDAVVAACRDALSSRNRLVHDALGDGVVRKREILGACRIIAQRMLIERAHQQMAIGTADQRAGESTLPWAPVAGMAAAAGGGVLGPVGVALAVGALLGGAVGKIVRRSQGSRTATPSKPAPDRLLRVESVSVTGTEHVRRFHSFIREVLDREVVAELVEHLRANGHVGRDDVVMLEHCVQMSDPAKFLADQLSLSQLRKEVAVRTGLQIGPDESARSAAERLLEYFGYPVSGELRGLTAIRREVEGARRRVAGAGEDVDVLRGAVTGVATQLEYAVLVLLRFVCVAAFGEDAEAHARNRGWLETSTPLEKLSLGALLDVLGKLAKELADETSPAAFVFQQSFESRRLSPMHTQDIPTLRNTLAHYGKLGDSPAPGQARDAAAAFLEAAEQFLAYLGDPKHRIFPWIIRIDQIQSDRWARRVILATNDEGYSETLFTDHVVEPGQLYLMHPLSNPLRVDPILVAAGELKFEPKTRAKSG
mgnify:FL=1